MVNTWPTELFSAANLVYAITARIRRPGGDNPVLWRLLAALYERQGRPDLSLAIHLQLRSPHTFAFIRAHDLAHCLLNKAPQLISIDAEQVGWVGGWVGGGGLKKYR